MNITESQWDSLQRPFAAFSKSPDRKPIRLFNLYPFQVVMMSKEANKDIYYMRKALELARLGRGKTSPNPMVGCVIVKNDMIIGEGYHQKAGEPHAEIIALNNAKENVAHSTIYITLEPCAHFGKTLLV
jgi:diaminohydroxyphosphoribosylaminopyrimidine deaminase/5-amino-6-(5-phosphoribosylamino)uracil reductase